MTGDTRIRFIRGDKGGLSDIIVGRFGLAFATELYTRDPEGYSSDLAKAYQPLLERSEMAVAFCKRHLQSVNNFHEEMEGELDPDPDFIHNLKEGVDSLLKDDEHYEQKEQLRSGLRTDQGNTETFESVIGFLEIEKSHLDERITTGNVPEPVLKNFRKCIELTNQTIQNYDSATQLADQAEKLQQGLYQRLKEHTD